MLLLAAAIGCTQGSGQPDAVPESTTDISTVPTELEAALDQVEFYCPGMT